MVRLKKKAPLVGKDKSRSLPFQLSAVCWLDLLGYGAMIAESDFNPLHPKSSEAISRLRSFHKVVADHSARYFPTLVMNDGAATYRDLSLRNRSVTHDFLVRAWNLYNEIKREEGSHGFPGARAVLAVGFRMRGRRAGIDATSGHFESVMRRYQAGELNADQAIREAASMRQTFDIVPQLQANFAFTKAYLADASGSASGLRGAEFYVDLAMFESPVPRWLSIGEKIDWSHDRLRMKGSFAPILDLPLWKHVEGGPVGILDGLQIAQKLAGDNNVLSALRSARKTQR